VRTSGAMKLAGGETSLDNKRVKLSFYFLIHKKKERILILLERERK
jgi:hypothetical protein